MPRRSLSFQRLDDVMPDVDRLLLGYTTVGRWTLGQICNHLGTQIRYSVEGYPAHAPWLVRKLIAPLVRRRVFSSGQMRQGVKVPEVYMPKPGLDDRAEAEALRATIKLFLAAPGPLPEHAFFGPLSRDDYHRLHCIHCAHHLSFALPSSAS
jgi:hypothetical protein